MEKIWFMYPFVKNIGGISYQMVSYQNSKYDTDTVSNYLYVTFIWWTYWFWLRNVFLYNASCWFLKCAWTYCWWKKSQTAIWDVYKQGDNLPINWCRMSSYQQYIDSTQFILGLLSGTRWNFCRCPRAQKGRDSSIQTAWADCLWGWNPYCPLLPYKNPFDTCDFFRGVNRKNPDPNFGFLASCKSNHRRVPPQKSKLNLKDSTTQLRALQGLEKLGWSQDRPVWPHARWFYMETYFFFFACLMCTVSFLTHDHIDIPANIQNLLIVLRFKLMVVV